MIEEVFDYYAQGLDRSKDFAELHKKAKDEYLSWVRKANQAPKGSKKTAADEWKARWAKAELLFSTAEGRQKYDQELAAWQNSLEAKNSKSRSEQEAQAFASAAETVLDLVARAWEELYKGNLVSARLVASKAIQTDSTNWEAYLVGGIASYRLDDGEEGMSCLRQAARLNPNSAAVYGCLGELYERMDNWQEAFSNYRKASALEPENSEFQVAMGLVCVKAEAPDEGIQYLRQVLAREPDNDGANWALGIALSESAQLGWTEVGEGHPRVAAGWYALSREQALQAVRKLNEAVSLKFDDPELTKDLSDVKKNVDKNVKRHFNGNWVLFGLILLAGVLGARGAGVLLAILFAAAYYAVNLVPQYATNARILAGDHALKRGFFDWLDNLQNPWIKLGVLCALFMLLPIFMVYWGIRNWTGENSPLGNALVEIRGPSTNSATWQGDVSDVNKTANTSPQQSTTVPESNGNISATPSGKGDVTRIAEDVAHVRASVPMPELSGNSNGPIPSSKGTQAPAVSQTSSTNNRLPIVIGLSLVLLFTAGGFYYFQSAQKKQQVAASKLMKEQEELSAMQAQVKREQENSRRKEQEARVLAERVAQLEASKRTAESTSVTFRNYDCNSTDLYLGDQKIVTLQAQTNQTMSFASGNYDLKACLANSRNCGNPTPISWRPGSATFDILRNASCDNNGAEVLIRGSNPNALAVGQWRSATTSPIDKSNVRSTPSIEGTVVTQLMPDVSIEVTQSSSVDWFEVRLIGRPPMGFLRKDRVNLR
jgi:tetratricopeptide (TPR) repeat protein